MDVVHDKEGRLCSTCKMDIEPDPTKRKCRKCKKPKPISKFYKSKVDVPCKDCQKIYKQWRAYKAWFLKYSRPSLSELRKAFFKELGESTDINEDEDVKKILLFSRSVYKMKKMKDFLSEDDQTSKKKDVPLRRMRLQNKQTLQPKETSRVEAPNENGRVTVAVIG